jgi:hypothetical protein
VAVVAVVAVVALVATLAVALSGKSNPTIVGRPVGSYVVLSALSATTAKQTAHLSLSETVTVGGHTIQLSGSGVTNLAQGSTDATLNVPALGASVRVIVLHHVIYELLPSAINTHPTPWVSVHIPRLTPSSGLGSITSGGDLLASLRLLAHRGDQVTDLGTASVAGVPTTQYQVVITPAVLKRQVSAAHLPSWLNSGLQAFSGSITESVFVDHSGLLRKMTVMMSLTVQGQSAQVSATTQLSHFGAAVSIVAPPRSEVTDLTPAGAVTTT